jgi:hypothetical protein
MYSLYASPPSFKIWENSNLNSNPVN